MRREPLLLPALGLCLGVAVAHFFWFSWADLKFPAVLATLAVVLAMLQSRSRTITAALSSLLFVAGVATQIAHRSGKQPRLGADDGDTVLLQGCVVDPPVFSPNREAMTVQLGKRARIRLSVLTSDATPGSEIPYGTRIEFPAKIHVPRNFHNPNAFDYAGYLASQNIFWTGSIHAATDIHVLQGRCGHGALRYLYDLRTTALNRLSAAFSGDEHARGMLAATLLGETSGVERQWTDEFRSTGTYHALVISGLHVWIVTATLLFFLKWCRVPKLYALFAGVMVSWAYAFIAGGHAPVIRAAAGFTLYFVAAFVYRRCRMLNLVALVAIVYLFIDPEALFDAAFQLSFLAAVAIACFAIPLTERFIGPIRESVKNFEQRRYDPRISWRACRWRVEWRLLAETISCWTRLPLAKAQTLVRWIALGIAFASEAALFSSAVQFALALPMAAYFHKLSLTGLTANIIVVPLLTVVVPAGFLAILTGSRWVAAVTAFLLRFAETLTHWHLRFEPSWRIAAIPFTPAVAFFVALVALAVVIRHKKQWIVPVFSAAFALFATIVLQPWRPLLATGKLEISTIDVGQGDSIFVAFPDGETMLVDAGGVPGLERMKRKPRMDVGEDVVSPYLWQRRLHRLDYAVLTHGHSDHMAGMGAVLDNFHPKELLTGAEPPTHEWIALESRAQADHVRIEQLRRSAPDRLIGGVRIRVLAPSPAYAEEAAAKNDDSLVLELTYGRRSVLLTGDAEKPTEADLADSGVLKNVTLLKVGHHGSKTSSSETLLASINPQFAFISDGYKNQFHHPHPDVLKRLAEHHVATFRTDQSGLLTFTTDGDRCWISTFD